MQGASTRARMAADKDTACSTASPTFPPPRLNIPNGIDRSEPYELSSLSPSRVLPPTPLGFFQLSPAAASTRLLGGATSPKYLQELWRDFDRVGGGLPGALEDRTEAGSAHLDPPSTTAVLHRPPLGTWRSKTTFKPVIELQQGDENDTEEDENEDEEEADEEAAFGPPSRKRRATPSRGSRAPPSRRPRGAYRCRKCGGPKRAHDCPFACRQRSTGTQTNLAITGNDSSSDHEAEAEAEDEEGSDGASYEEEE